MNDKYEAAFEKIVFAITRLLFGDARATEAASLSLVRHALSNLGVWEAVKGLRDG